MGNTCSGDSATRNNARRDKSSQTKSIPEGNGHEMVDSTKDHKRDKLDELRALVKDRPNEFILNNLLLAVQLFTHYENDIKKAQKEVEEQEAELSRKLLPGKLALLPDALSKHFHNRLSFNFEYRRKQTVEQLRPTQIYLVYDNVLVTENDNSHNYSNHNELATSYVFLLEEIDNKGHVRLQQSSNTTSKKELGSDITKLLSPRESQTDCCNRFESVKDLVDCKRQSGSDTSSMNPYSLDEDVYCEPQAAFHDSARGSHSETTSISASRSRGFSSSAPSSANSTISSGYQTSCTSEAYSELDPSEIPGRCFKRVTFTEDNEPYVARAEAKPLTSRERRIRDEKLKRNYHVLYVHAHRFSRHFSHAFNQLADNLGFDRATVKNAKRDGAAITLEKIDYAGRDSIGIEQFEVIPCFSSPWTRWARDWLYRSRLHWPALADLRHVEASLGCYLVPGHARPGVHKLEWNLSFPTAERHLEGCLSPEQATVLSIALLVHKTFMGSKGHGLGVGHLRNAIFWMAEEQPDWSEFELGEWLMHTLELLHAQMTQHTMSDYFVPGRNLLADVAPEYLHFSQKQLKRMIDNPVMFVVHAMEKIHYGRSHPYPALNYAELVRLLTADEILVANSNIQQLVGRESAPSGGPKQMEDSIVVFKEKCEPLKSVRLSSVLLFFSNHFLAMARCCHKQGMTSRKQAYLEQTELLASLLNDDGDYSSCAQTIMKKRHELLELNVDLSMVSGARTDPVPETPRRNIEMSSLTKTLVNDTRHLQTEQCDKTGIKNSREVGVDIHRGEK